jgi:predicted phosphodiesterase
MAGIDELRTAFDGLRWIFAGHTHHQIYVQTELVNFVNPGAICASIDGSHEFAILDTDTNELVFSRILRTKPVEPECSIGIISDSFHISKIDSNFWKKLSTELKRHNVTSVIHCGGIAAEDIGCKELHDFQVHYYSRNASDRKPPSNWHAIDKNHPLINVGGREFYLHTRLAQVLLEESEIDMHQECLKILENNPETSFILYGGTNNAFLGEGQRARIINLGDILSSRNFAVIKLPITEITFGHVPVPPLPPLE